MCTKKRSNKHTVRWQLPVSQEKRPQNETYLAGISIMDFLDSGPVRNKFLLFKPPSL